MSNSTASQGNATAASARNAAKSMAAKAWAAKHRYYHAMGEQAGELLFGIGAILLCLVLLHTFCLDAPAEADGDEVHSDDEGSRIGLPNSGLALGH
eukprot:4214923-Pleurochrysis_carterae.AAC.1